MSRFSLLLSVSFVLGVGCSQPKSTADQSPASRDSAGISIVENSAPEWKPGEVWTVDSVPSLVIGDSGSHPPFEESVSGKMLPGGKVALVNHASGRVSEVGILIFDSTGRYLGTVGRRGQGPGEFTDQPMFMGAGLDTIVCWQRDNGRLVWFTTGGKLVRHVAVRRDSSSSELFAIGFTRQDVRPDGAMLLTIELQTRERQPGLRDVMRAVFVGRDSGSTVVSYGTFEVQQYLFTENSRERNPFQIDRPIALGPDPLPVSVAGRTHWEVQQFDVDGKLRRIIRARIPQNAMPESFVKWGKEKGFAAPDSGSAIGALRHDRAGHWWVGRAGVGGLTYTYDVFSDATGRWLGTVRLPQDIGNLQDIAGDYVLTSRQLETGPQVELRRIRRTGGRADRR